MSCYFYVIFFKFYVMKNVCVQIFAVFFVAFLFAACNNDHDHFVQDDGQEIKISATTDVGTFVSLLQATDVANAFFGGQSTLKSTGTQKRIVSSETIKDKENPSMYVMNYVNTSYGNFQYGRENIFVYP